MIYESTMNRSLAAVFLLLAISGTVAASANDEARIKVERSEQSLRIRARVFGKEQWRELATFVMDPKLRPYLHPLRDGVDTPQIPLPQAGERSLILRKLTLR